MTPPQAVHLLRQGGVSVGAVEGTGRIEVTDMPDILGDDVMVRNVHDGDRDGLLELWSVTWSATYAPLIGQPAIRAMIEGLAASDLRDMLPAPDEERAVVAVLAGTIVGSAILAERRSIAYLWGMYVHPSRQRRGIGTALLRQAVGRLSSAATIEVKVLETSPWAIAFYERCGFLETGREAMPLGGGHPPVPGRIMTVPLDAMRQVLLSMKMQDHARRGIEATMVSTPEAASG